MSSFVQCGRYSELVRMGRREHSGGVRDRKRGGVLSERHRLDSSGERKRERILSEEWAWRRNGSI